MTSRFNYAMMRLDREDHFSDLFPDEPGVGVGPIIEISGTYRALDPDNPEILTRDQDAIEGDE